MAHPKQTVPRMNPTPRQNPTMIATVADFDRALKSGPYTSVGSYPIYFLTNDGDAISFKNAKKNAGYIRAAIKEDESGGGWHVVAVAINWEDPSLFDDDSGERIESAYAEDSAKRANPSGDGLSLKSAVVGAAVAAGVAALLCKSERAAIRTRLSTMIRPADAEFAMTGVQTTPAGGLRSGT